MRMIIPPHHMPSLGSLPAPLPIKIPWEDEPVRHDVSAMLWLLATYPPFPWFVTSASPHQNTLGRRRSACQVCHGTSSACPPSRDISPRGSSPRIRPVAVVNYNHTYHYSGAWGGVTEYQANEHFLTGSSPAPVPIKIPLGGGHWGQRRSYLAGTLRVCGEFLNN